MKTRYFILSCFLLLSTGILIQSCDECVTGNGKIITKKIKIGDIRRIRLSGDANITLVSDSTDEMTVVGESNIIELYQFDESGTSLKIKTDRCTINHETVKITIPVKVIEALTMNGSGDINSASRLKASDLELNINGSGDINLEIEAEDVSGDINGSGNIVLKGSAKNQRYQINGSGDVEASDFMTGTTKVTINGSGDCKVMVSSALNVIIRGSGNVYYKGTPDINTEVKGSGSVSKIE